MSEQVVQRRDVVVDEEIPSAQFDDFRRAPDCHELFQIGIRLFSKTIYGISFGLFMCSIYGLEEACSIAII